MRILVLGSGAREHATTLVVNLDTPANDDVPPWVRDADDLPGPR